ncbi:hypothetical protein FQN49_002806, partial [Arthroderma sp. PD_2]
MIAHCKADFPGVKQLCAAGTIGIAPAGFALGRPETVKRHSTLAYQRASFFGGEPDTALPSPLSPRQQPPFSSLQEQQRQQASFAPGETPRPSRTSPPDSRTFPLDEELSTAAKLDALIQRTDEKILLRPRRENNLTILTRDVEESPCLEPQSVPNSGRPSSSW